MPWMVSLHIAFILFWSAGLLGLIYLLASHHVAHDAGHMEFLRVIERKLYFHITTPAAVLSVLSGLWLLFSRGYDGGWLPVKLILVSIMVAAHVYSGTLFTHYWLGRQRHGPRFYLGYNLLQMLMICGIFQLVTSKPF